MTSTAVPPKPSCSAGTGKPISPISAIVAQTSGLQPVGEATIFRRASKL
jgi:hypothetical protein